jgi:hypothetical protein
MFLGEAVQSRGEHLQLAGHAAQEDFAAAFVDDLGGFMRVAGDTVVKLAQLGQAFGIDLYAANNIQQVIAGGTT